MNRIQNYARNVRTKELVFIEAGMSPELRTLSADWVWWTAPSVAPDSRLVGETPNEYCRRMAHRPRVCVFCAGIGFQGMGSTDAGVQ